MCENVEAILAMEWLCGSQAREFHRELRAGRGAEAAYACLRRRVEPLGADRYMHADIEAALELVREGKLVEAVEGAVGALAV